MEVHLKGVGVLLMLLGLTHAAFPRYFNWRTELGALTLLTRQMMYIHTLFIGLIVLLMGVLCWSSAPELVATTLGRKVALGLGVFWLVRLLVQFFGYAPELWRKKRFETTVHVVFSLLWFYLTGVFFVVALR